METIMNAYHGSLTMDEAIYLCILSAYIAWTHGMETRFISTRMIQMVMSGEPFALMTSN